MKKYKQGEIIKGVVSGIEKYGVFVKLENNYNGLIHISELSDSYVRNVEDYAKVGTDIYAEIIAIDDNQQQIKLSIKNLTYKNGVPTRKQKIEETSLGFKTLERNLPYWIEKNLKNNKKQINSIDK